MAEGGFDPNDPNVFEMIKDVIPPVDEDITQNDSEFSQPEGSQQESSFIIPEGSQESKWIENHRDDFKSKYKIDDNTFDVLRTNLRREGDNIYYRDTRISFNKGGTLLELNSIKGDNATKFKNIVKENQQQLIKVSQRPKQPIKPTVSTVNGS